jgi:nucleoside-diphosphate-sugar epimerase
MSGRIVVLGAAGRFGRIAAEAFRDAGWNVASLVRASAVPRAAPGTEIVEVDARDTAAVIEAARGADVVLHALNPPYTEWPKLALPFADTAIAAAREAGATLLFPGNIYNFGKDMPAVLDETTAMHPNSRKGALRVEIERRMRAASGERLRVLILRAGDFFGGTGTGSWFDRVIAKDVGGGQVTYPGPLDVVHAWAYLPDFAAAMVRLAAMCDRLGPFEQFGFPGHAVTGRQLVAAIARAMGREMSVSTMPWWLLRALSPVVPIYRELTEMAYLWRTPHRIDGSKLAHALGAMRLTALDDAVATALRDLGLTVQM